METQIVSASQANITRAAAILRQGGLVAVPTETVYGLAANALDPAAAARIYAAKGRPSDNPLIVHISDTSELAPLVRQVPDICRILAQQFWPGPLTIVLPASAAVPKQVTGGLDTVAVRCPAHPVARAVIRAAGLPLAAPSANSSGRPSPTTAAHVYADLHGKIPMILDAGPCEIGVESTVLSLAGEHPTVLRPGGVSVDRLEAVIGPVAVSGAVFAPMADDDTPMAPGMKYRHYAPRAPITLFSGPDDAVIRRINSLADSRTGILCFNGEERLFSAGAPVPYGDRDDPLDLSHNLFSALRRFDDLGVCGIYGRMCRQDGAFLGVANRLLKAAGFHMEKVDR